MSKRDCCWDSCIEDDLCCECGGYYPHPKPVLLVCGQGLTCELDNDRDKTECAFLEIDTSCLYKPLVKIDFCANICATVTDKYRYGTRAKLTFKLVKVCENGNYVTLGKWYYLRDLDFVSNETEGFEDNLEINEPDELDGEFESLDEFQILTTKDSFCFTTCECQSCPGCCIYKVIVYDKSGRYVDVDIKDIQINAIAQDKC